MSKFLEDLSKAGAEALGTLANKAILGSDAATKIALRQAESDYWAQYGAAGALDREGAAADAAAGPIQTRNPFTNSASPLGGSMMTFAIVGVAVLIGYLVLRKAIR